MNTLLIKSEHQYCFPRYQSIQGIKKLPTRSPLPVFERVKIDYNGTGPDTLNLKLSVLSDGTTVQTTGEGDKIGIGEIKAEKNLFLQGDIPFHEFKQKVERFHVLTAPGGEVTVFYQPEMILFTTKNQNEVLGIIWLIDQEIVEPVGHATGDFRMGY